MNKREMLRSLIKAAHGQECYVTFVKKNLEKRTLIIQDGVESHKVFPNGVGSNRQEHCPNLITLFDVQAGRYKSINLDTVTRLKCGEKVLWDE